MPEGSQVLGMTVSAVTIVRQLHQTRGLTARSSPACERAVPEIDQACSGLFQKSVTEFARRTELCSTYQRHSAPAVWFAQSVLYC